MYMYHTHTMEKVHGINLSTCSDLPLMNIMIISQIDLQWTQFNSIFDLRLILRHVHCLIFKEERMLQYQYLTDLPRSNRTWHRKPIHFNAVPNLHMTFLPNCNKYGYFLISLKSSQTSFRCSLPDSYVTRAAANLSVPLTQAKPSTPQSQVSSITVFM